MWLKQMPLQVIERTILGLKIADLGPNMVTSGRPKSEKNINASALCFNCATHQVANCHFRQSAMQEQLQWQQHTTKFIPTPGKPKRKSRQCLISLLVFRMAFKLLWRSSVRLKSGGAKLVDKTGYRPICHYVVSDEVNRLLTAALKGLVHSQGQWGYNSWPLYTFGPSGVTLDALGNSVIEKTMFARQLLQTVIFN